MGLSLGSLGSTIACCFANAYCSFCCAACPACKGSTSTRFAYCLILFMYLIVAFIMLLPGLDDGLMKISHLCEHSLVNNQTGNCENIVASRAIYRISLGMAIFFCFLSLFVS